MYKAVIFDLDGTILDTLQDLKGSMNYALKSCGFPVRSAEEIRRFLGNGVYDLAARSVPSGTGEEAQKQVVEQFNAHYAVHCSDATRPYEGIPGLLQILRQKQIFTAVVSNKPDYAVQELCRKHFAGFFDYVTGVRTGVARKPAPDLVNEALKAIGCRTEDAVYIGDSEVDILTSEAAKMHCISVSWGFRDVQKLIEAGAKEIVESPLQLQKLLCGDPR